MRSCSSSPLVHESAEQVAPVDLGRLILATEGRFDSWIRRLQPERPMGTTSVVVGSVDPKNLLEVAVADDQQPVQPLGARRPHPALGLGVRVECLHRCDEPSAFSEGNTSSKLRVNFASRLRTNKGQPSSLWMRKFDPQLTGAAGTTPCVRRASVFECCWESAGVLLPAAIIRFLKACVSLSTNSVQMAAVISLLLPSARRWAARDGAKRVGTPSDGGSRRQGVCARHER
jgi:hypothetical protein